MFRGKEIRKAESVKSFCAKEQEILKERTRLCGWEHPGRVNRLHPVPVSSRKDGEQKHHAEGSHQSSVEQKQLSQGTEHWEAKGSHEHKVARTRPEGEISKHCPDMSQRPQRKQIELKRKYLDGGSSYR